MSASALQRAASVIGAMGGSGSGSGGGSGRSTPTQGSSLNRASSLRNPQTTGGQPGPGGGTQSLAAMAAAQAGPHSLSLKVMRISAPALVRVQDRAYFEVPDENFSPGLPATDEQPASASASASARAQASSLVQDISYAEAGEMQRLYAALAQAAEEGSSGQSNIGAAERALRSAAASDMLSNQSLSGASGSRAMPTVRDWPTSDVLVLPSSFGTIHLGEAFQAYICLNNETNEPVKNASLHVEIQQAEREDEGADRLQQSGPSSNPTTILAHIGAPVAFQTVDTSEEGRTTGGEDHLLQPQAKLETTVRHEMRKPGGYVLGCTVSYQAWLPAPGMATGGYEGKQHSGQGQWIERSFRKSYRFAVPTCPLTVRSKAHAFFPLPSPPSSASESAQDATWKSATSDSILLEVQIRNDCPRALVLERTWLDSDIRALGLVQAQDAAAVGLSPPFAGWDWESIDRPWLECKAQTSEAAVAPDKSTQVAGMSRTHFGLSPSQEEDADADGIWNDEDQWLLPGDMRQFIFRLTPALSELSDKAETTAIPPSLRDLLPPPPGPKIALPQSLSSTSSIASDLASENAATARSPPPPLPGKGPAPRTTRYSIRGAPPTPYSPPPLQQAAQPPPPLQLMVPLGKLDIAWRMAGAGGEAGRLQTSMLYWRREVAHAPQTQPAAPPAAESRPASLIRSPPGTPSSASAFIRSQQPK